MTETLRDRTHETDLRHARRVDGGHGQHRALVAADRPAAMTGGLDDSRIDTAELRHSLRRLHEEMMGAALSGEGVEEIARIAAGASGLPVMLVIPDLVGTVVAPANDSAEDLASLDSWARERAQGRPSAIRDELAAETPVTLGERIVGVVGIVGPPGAAEPYAHWVLDVAAASIATIVAIDEARLETEHAIRGSFLEQLRSGESLSRGEILRRSARLGSDLSCGAVVLCVEVATSRPRQIATTIADEHPGAFVEVVDRAQDDQPSQLWALLPAARTRAAEPRSAADTEQAANGLAVRLRQHGAVGVSRFHEDPTELHRAIDEAQLMLEVARRVASPTGDEIVDGTYKLLFRLLASHPEELHTYHETTLAPLVRHDDQYRTDLVRTLDAYLNTNCNMNMAAELVFAHRHTVAHRLDRIRELTGLDATVYEDRERLGLGLKIHRLTS